MSWWCHTSGDLQMKHLLSPLGSGVWVYRHTGHLDAREWNGIIIKDVWKWWCKNGNGIMRMDVWKWECNNGNGIMRIGVWEWDSAVLTLNLPTVWGSVCGTSGCRGWWARTRPVVKHNMYNYSTNSLAEDVVKQKSWVFFTSSASYGGWGDLGFTTP